MPASPLTVSFNVPTLPDIGVWFANSAAWSAYWRQAVSANFTPISNSIYVEVAPSGPQYYNFQMDLDGDGIAEDNIVPSKAAFDQLVTNYKNLRQVMKNAGLITEAQ